MLRVEGLHTYYGRGHILQGVDLEVPAGEIAAVLGRNGVGKTTTLRSIIGLARPQRGRVLLAGKDVAGWAPHRIVRLGVGYVPEGRMIFPELTVVENIQVAQRVPARQWSMERLFEIFPSLAERRRSKGSQLSGGEQQMLAVARALVTDPRIILLDEPSHGLAPPVVEELIRLIPRLRVEGGCTPSTRTPCSAMALPSALVKAARPALAVLPQMYSKLGCSAAMPTTLRITPALRDFMRAYSRRLRLM